MDELLKNNKFFYVPSSVVNQILNGLGYQSIFVFYQKHILDIAASNDCFLSEIIIRTIEGLIAIDKSKDAIKQYLETYIHIIEIDHQCHHRLAIALDILSERYGIYHVKWDFQTKKAIENNLYIGMMDYIVGNIIHTTIEDLHLNCSQYTTLLNKQTKKYNLHNSKSQEFYFEYGLQCLKPQEGKLCYLSSNTWLISDKYLNFRKFLLTSAKIEYIINYNYNFTQITDQLNKNCALTLLTRMSHPNKFISIFEAQNDNCFENGMVVLQDEKQPFRLPLSHDNLDIDNVMASLDFCEFHKPHNLEAFLIEHQNYCEEWDDFLIDIFLVTKNTWAKLIFPYTQDTMVFNYEKMPFSLQQWLQTKMVGIDFSDESQWYAYCNPEFIKMLTNKKLVFNKTFDAHQENHVHFVDCNQAILGGYVLLNSQLNRAEINLALKSEPFLRWVQCQNKAKQGHKYTLTMTVLAKYLTWWFTKKAS